jgi:hypothetical protein
MKIRQVQEAKTVERGRQRGAMKAYFADLGRQGIPPAGVVLTNNPQSDLKTRSHDVLVEKTERLAMTVGVAKLGKVLFDGNSRSKALGKCGFGCGGAFFYIAESHIYSIGHEHKKPQ